MAKKRGMMAKEYMDALNVEASCAYCGETEHATLQWHHRNPKEKLFNVSSAWKKRGLAAVASEVAKCIRLCANCHLKAHAGLIDISKL